MQGIIIPYLSFCIFCSASLSFGLLLLAIVRENIQGYGEYHRRVLLRGYRVQGLKYGNRVKHGDRVKPNYFPAPAPTCKYLSCNAAGLSEIVLEASLSAWLAFCSPSAVITCRENIRLRLLC